MVAAYLYAILNCALSILFLVMVNLLAYRHWDTIKNKAYLRWIFPIMSLFYIYFGIAYGQIVLMPESSAHVGATYIRPGFTLFLIATFLSVNLVTQDAERLKITRLSLMESQQARAREQQEFFEFRERWLKEREDFISIALHELNTPLTLLNGYVLMFAQAANPDQAKEFAQEIVRTTGRFFVMKTMFDAKLHRMDITPFLLHECIQAALDDEWLFTATRKQPGEIRISVSCDETVVVEADFNKIKFVFWEMVRNGLKATEADGQAALERGVKTTAEDGRVLIDVEANDELVLITVEDNGVGIPENYQSRIFEAGSQYFKDMTTRRNEGTGHGLHVVNHIMLEHNGDIVLDWSEVGAGTRFALYLPRR